jgi:hypothetical protein
MMRNNVDGYHAVNPICVDSAKDIKQLTKKEEVTG